MSSSSIENARNEAILAEQEYVQALSEFDQFSKSFHKDALDSLETLYIRDETRQGANQCSDIETISVEDVIIFEKTQLSDENSVTDGTTTISEIVSESDQKRETLCNHIVEELVSTEFEYLKSLYFLLKNFLTPIHSLIETKDDRKISKHIMNNIKMMHTFGTHFLDDLTKSSSTFETIGHVFVKHKKLFNRYAKISKNWNRYERIVHQGAPSISNAIKKIELELNEPLGFSRYIVKPMQRLGKYELLLNNMHKQLKRAQEPDRPALLAASALINEVLNLCNTILAVESIEFNRYDEHQSGNFLMRMNMKLITKKERHHKSSRHKVVHDVEMFLFQKVVIIAINIQGDLHYCDGILITNLRKNNQDDKLKFTLEDFHAFKMFKRSHSIVLEAANFHDKEKCIRAIDDLLWGQLMRLKEEVSTKSIHSKEKEVEKVQK